MAELPTGTVTFLFSDIEGSSSKWERLPEEMRVALAQHDQLLRNIFEDTRGYVFKTVGDAFCVAFDRAPDALVAAVEAQRALLAADWHGIEEMKVRMAIHTGSAEQRDGDYFGPTLNRVARVLASAHGGQVLLSSAAQELVRDHLPVGVQLRPLGEHRLRDLARPEQLFQLMAAGLPAQFPALRSLESVPNNLPVQLTSFVGREREQAEVKRLLQSTRLLTLTGAGGTGKTRLSLQVAAEELEFFPDGVWFVEFATVEEGSAVVEAVASVLDLRQEPGRPLATTLAASLRGQQALFVFDNCEHVVVECARLAENLLRAAPRIRILASSREPLAIAGETAWPLPPLALPEHWRDVAGEEMDAEQLESYEAVRLFNDRARLARPTFQPTLEDLRIVARICWRLDGIALAIELAAARVRVLSLPQILERLEDRFHLLTGGSRTATRRQQTLRSLIDWSFDLLSEAERKLFRRLCVFARGRTLEAIEQVCSSGDLEAWEVMNLLSQLVDKSLVHMEKSPQGERYVLLESMWDYAHEKLEESGESAEIRIRHLEYFARFAGELAPHLCGPEQKTYLERAEVEEGNFRTATETSLEIPGQESSGLQMMVALSRFVEVRGIFNDSRTQILKLLDLPANRARTALRAEGLYAAGRFAWIGDDVAAARASFTEAVEIFRELQILGGTARALVSLAFLEQDGNLDLARSLLAQAETLADGLKEPSINSQLYHVQGQLSALDANFEEALRLEQESLQCGRKAGDHWQCVIYLWNIGVNAIALGRYDLARESLVECLQMGLNVGTGWGATYPLDAFATLAAAEGRFGRAAKLFGASEARRARVGLIAQAASHPALREAMSHVANFTGPVVQRAREEGRTLRFQEAVELAFSAEE